MPSKNLPDPILITKGDELKQLAAKLSQEPIIAVDTESNSLYAYQEKVCLIQFSIPEEDYLVDPLALKDLSPLERVFSSDSIEKVFHAAEYDLIVLERDFGFRFANLFDTMVAGRILGWRAVGLSSILKNEFGVHVNKRFQRANWGQRPLPAKMLNYARLDTHYLIPLRERQYEALKEKNLWSLAEEDFRRASQVNTPSPNNDRASCWRINGAADLPEKQLAILQELCRYRDRVAKSLNRPLFKVMSNKALLELAKTQPRNKKELARVHGISQRQAQRHGGELLDTIQRGAKSKPKYPPPQPRPDERFLEQLDRLRNWRKNTARKMGVGSDVVMPRDLLEALAEQNPQDKAELEGVLESVPWRIENFGDQILYVLQKG